MKTFHFKLGTDDHRINLSVEASDPNGALAKIQGAFSHLVILKAWVGESDGGKVRYPELKGRQLFKEPKASALFSEPPLLIED